MENYTPRAVLDVVTLGVGVVLLDVGGKRLWQHIGHKREVVYLLHHLVDIPHRVFGAAHLDDVVGNLIQIQPDRQREDDASFPHSFLTTTSTSSFSNCSSDIYPSGMLLTASLVFLVFGKCIETELFVCATCASISVSFQLQKYTFFPNL